MAISRDVIENGRYACQVYAEIYVRIIMEAAGTYDVGVMLL